VIRLKPTQDPQTFKIIPSSYSSVDLDAASITFVENGTGKQGILGFDSVWSTLDENWNTTNKFFVEPDTFFTYALSSDGNYIEITMTTDLILKEGQIYTLSILGDQDILYRDLVYITEETSKKDVFTLPDAYEEYDTGKTEYIVL